MLNTTILHSWRKKWAANHRSPSALLIFHLSAIDYQTTHQFTENSIYMATLKTCFQFFFFCWVSFGSGWSKDDIMPSWFGGNWALWISVVGWVSPRFWRRLFVISRGKGLHVLCNLDLGPVSPLAGHSSCPPLFNTHPLEKTAQPIFKVERENHVKEKTHEWEYILKISWKYL